MGTQVIFCSFISIKRFVPEREKNTGRKQLATSYDANRNSLNFSLMVFPRWSKRWANLHENWVDLVFGKHLANVIQRALNCIIWRMQKTKQNRKQCNAKSWSGTRRSVQNVKASNNEHINTSWSKSSHVSLGSQCFCTMYKVCGGEQQKIEVLMQEGKYNLSINTEIWWHKKLTSELLGLKVHNIFNGIS